MNEFNVLLTAATNGTPSGSLFDALFARYIAPQESWRELESPLPITILTAGEDLIDYRIYGANGGVGEPTESGEPAGYKLPMVVRSGNLLNQDADGWQRNCKINSTGDVITANYYFDASPYIEIEPETVYTLVDQNGGFGVYNAFYDVDKNFISSFEAFGHHLYTATSPLNAKYIRCSVLAKNVYPDSARQAMLIEGDTEPPAYIPYYRDEENIYIGSDPLAEDEYVDFGEQKIYRMVDGTLTPADPPVPIPALPTIQGKTIIDYNPSTTPAVEPEKMYIKYKPQ